MKNNTFNLRKSYLRSFHTALLIFLFLSISFLRLYGTSFKTSNPVILDPTLINGKQYVFNVFQVEGHQFLGNENFIKGTLTLKGETYHNLDLRYDIYNQELTLRFTNQFESQKIIIVSNAWLTGFTMGDKKFELIDDENGTKRIYQTLGTGNVRVIYSWKKDLRLNTSNGLYSFTRPFRGSYILIDDIKHQYLTNRGFAKVFGENISPMVKKYLRQNRIKVAKADDLVIEELINYCNSIQAK
jgi:hypothetical protein